jgi:hypothetical protein
VLGPADDFTVVRRDEMRESARGYAPDATSLFCGVLHDAPKLAEELFRLAALVIGRVARRL